MGQGNRLPPVLWDTFYKRGPETLPSHYLFTLLLAETIRIVSRKIYSDKTPQNCEPFNSEFT